LTICWPETRALLSLPPHSGLAHARDDFFDGDRHVLVLDWVGGVNLARLLTDEGRPGLPVSSVLHWVARTADALTVLHRHGVVHGDVKPANLILDRDGRIVLVDLGSSSAPPTSTPRGGLLRVPGTGGLRRWPGGTGQRRVQPGGDRLRATDWGAADW
jgi:serine/threonine protein kinase